MVSFTTFLAIVTAFLLMLIPLPVLFVIFWRKKHFPVNSFFSGAAVFILFYLVVRYYIMTTLGNSGPYASMAALILAAFAVEGGRFCGFLLLPVKVELPGDKLSVALSQAMGYMTAAFLLINTFEMAMNFVYAGALNGWEFLANYLNRFPRESVDQVQAMIIGTPAVTYLLEVLSLYLAVPVQVCLSLLVFESFRQKSRGLGRWGFLLAAVALNFLYFQIGSSLSSSGWAVHLLYLTFSAAAAVGILLRFWKEELIDTFGAS